MRGTTAALPWVTLLVGATVVGGAEPAGQSDSQLRRRIESAPRLEVELLGEPVKSIRRGKLLWAPNPDGKSWDLLQIYFPRYGGPNSIVVIDLGSGHVERIDTEAGWNFHLCPAVVAPNGKLFISILGRKLQQKICIYDPATGKLAIDAVMMPEELLGETHPLVLGTDGKLYAIGQHPSKAAAAAQIDPDTLEVTFYGPIGPSHAPNACWGYSGAADDRYIYLASGKVPWYLVAFDRYTGTWETLAETAPVGGYVGVSQQADGCSGHASGVVGTDGKRIDYWLYDGKAIPKSQQPVAPWPLRAVQVEPPPKPEVSVALAVPDADGLAEIWVRSESATSGSAKTALGGKPGVSDVGSGASKRGGSTGQEAAGTSRRDHGGRSQSPDQWRRFRFQVPLYPHVIYRLVEMPDGRLLGTAGAYEGNFIFDPTTGRSHHLGKIALSHYATAFLGGKVYMSGYPTSPLYQWDPNKPWTAGKFIGGRVIGDDDPAANPRPLMYLGRKQLAGTHKMYAAAVGADGKVYFGGRWIRDGAAGGLAWYDPSSGEAGGMWERFSNYQITHMAAACGGRLVVISTRRVDDPLLGKPKPAQGALFFFDTRCGELVGQFEPVPGAKGTGPIVAVRGHSVMGWTEDPEDPKSSYLYRVELSDPASARLAFRRRLPFALPVAIGSNQQEAWDFRTGPDRMVWTFIDGVLVRIDPQQGCIEPVGRPPGAGRIAFSGGRVYLGGTTHLRRIKNLSVPAGQP